MQKKLINNQQDFLSGRVINLIKETQKNIATARKENKNERLRNKTK